MNRKKYYRIETKNRGFVVFFVFLLLPFVVVGNSIIQAGLRNVDYGQYIGLGVIGVLLCVFGYISISNALQKKDFVRSRIRIKSFGTKVRGKVVSIERQNNGIGNDNFVRYRAMVAFFVNGEEVRCRTPELNFCPDKLSAGDTEADVYIYQNEYYIDNFSMGNKHVSAWDTYKVVNLLKLICLGLGVLAVLPIYLSVKDIISFNMSIVLICILGVLVVIGVIIIGILTIRDIKDELFKKSD